jgi:hypothetical protein
LIATGTAGTKRNCRQLTPLRRSVKSLHWLSVKNEDAALCDRDKDASYLLLATYGNHPAKTGRFSSPAKDFTKIKEIHKIQLTYAPK